MKLKVNSSVSPRINIFSNYSIINNKIELPLSNTQPLDMETCLSNDNVEMFSINILNIENKFIERIQLEKDVNHWAKRYQELINVLNSNLEKGEFKSLLKHTFTEYRLRDFLDTINFISDEMDEKVIFYSLINILSKYPYIKKFSGCKSYSISPQGFVNLSIIKKHKEYSSILNLEFCADGKITFNTHDNEVNDFLLHGTFISPKKYLSNKKFRLLLRLLDD